MLEVSTFWREQLIDHRWAPTTTWAEGTHVDGALVHVVSKSQHRVDHLVSAQPDWHFLRILTVLLVVTVMVAVMFELTPRTQTLYVLQDHLGTMKLAPGPGGLGRIHGTATFVAPGVHEPARPRRVGPLVPSPPGSRTHQAPPEAISILAMLRTNTIPTSKLMGSVGFGDAPKDIFGTSGIGGIEGGVIGGVIGGDNYSVSGARTRRVGMGTIGSRGGGGVGGTIGALSSKKTTVRSVSCAEVARAVTRFAKSPVTSAEREQLLRLCRTRASSFAMTCVVRIADERGDVDELLDKCRPLPPLYREVLTR